MQKQRLILVGNKPPKRKNLAQIIDSFDFVVRINRMNYLGKAGNKTDGIFYEANWQFNNIYKGGEHKDQLKEIGKIFMRERWHESFFSEWHRYISREQYEHIEVINEYHAVEATKFERLTTSILMLGHLVNEDWKEKYDIHITCLDVENRAYLIDNDPNWDYHKGAGVPEQEYLMELLKQKKISRLHDD